MKFSNIVSVAILGLGVSGTLVRRDLTTINNVLSTIADQLSKLDSAVTAFSDDVGPLKSANDQVLSTLKSGTSTISGTSSLSETDAVGVAGSVQSLETSVKKAVTDLISKKSAIVAAGAGGTILQALQDQSTASQALAKALTSKVPTDLQTVAASLSANIQTDIQKGIDAFQGTGGSGGGSSSPTGSPTTTAPGKTTTAKTTTTSASGSVGGGSSPTGSSISASGSAPLVTSTGAASAQKVGGSLLGAAAVMGLLL